MNTLTRRSFVAGSAVASIAATTVAGTAVASETATSPEVAQVNAGWLEPEPELPEPVETVTVDALVIGAGTGGLEVGTSLAEKGLKTLILEQNADASTLRNNWGAIGSKYQQEEGTELDERAIMNYHVMQNSGRFDQHLPKIWARESAEAIDWVGGVLESYGAVMLHEGGYEAAEGLGTIPKFATGHAAVLRNPQHVVCALDPRRHPHRHPQPTHRCQRRSLRGALRHWRQLGLLLRPQLSQPVHRLCPRSYLHLRPPHCLRDERRGSQFAMPKQGRCVRGFWQNGPAARGLGRENRAQRECFGIGNVHGGVTLTCR